MLPSIYRSAHQRPELLALGTICRCYTRNEIQRDWKTEFVQLLASRENERKIAERKLKEENLLTTRNVVRNFLSFHDDLKRYADFSKGDKTDDLCQLEQSFLRILANLGVTRLNTRVGDKYDPKYHEALNGDEKRHLRGASLVVGEVLSLGFVQEGTVLRPSYVVTKWEQR